MSSVEKPPEGLGAEYAQQAGPYVLNCGYCNWSSKEIGIQFEKPNGIYGQLLNIRNGGEVVATPKDRRRDRLSRRRAIPGDAEDGEGKEAETAQDPNEKLDIESQFSNLILFYQSQLGDNSPSGALGFAGDYSYGSPGTLARLMGIYAGSSGFSDSRSKTKPAVMREAANSLEGLQLTANTTSSHAIIAALRTGGIQSTPTTSQRREQTHEQATHALSDLRPIQYLLRTKRSKRCKTCRHILSKPESKVQTTRFRIRLVALNYIPSIAIKPLQPLPPGQTSFPLLTPMKPVQFLLTFKNPLFESVKVTLATPGKTPGRFGSKVTVLCPQFEIGANTDAWEEALGSGGGSAREKRRTKAEMSEGQGQAEAGKVWERGRNWVSIVVEVVPASLKVEELEWLKTEEQKKAGGEWDGDIREDEDVLEIPVWCRVEWEADARDDEGGLGGLAKGEGREKKELAYWCVLGVGKISQE